MKNEYSGDRQIEFYSPGGNHYHSKVKLWFIAKISNCDGRLWLETSWSGSEGDISRLSVFTSRLDAEIQCRLFNASSLSNWKVYQFDDLDLHLMMKTVFLRGNSVLGISMIFGFSSSSASELSSRSAGFCTTGTPCDLQLNSSTLQDSPPIIEFENTTFRFIEDCWESTIPDFFESITEINDLSQEELSTIADEAIRMAKLIPEPVKNTFAKYVSTYNPAQRAWHTSAELNRNLLH